MNKVFLYISWLIMSFIITVSTTFAAIADDNVKEQTNDFIDRLLTVFSKEYALRILFATITIILTYLVSRVVKDKLFSYIESRIWWDVTWKDEIIWVINRTVNVIILFTWFSITLWVLWVDLWIFMWWIWFGIGFTLRVFLTNFISWVLMVTQWIYHPGDFIWVAWKTWHIFRIYSLFTAIRQLDWVMYYVPNVKFIEDDVSNYHTNEKRRLNVRIYVDYVSDTVKTKAVLNKVIESFPNILQTPAPIIVIEKLWEWGVVMDVRFWILSKDNFITLKSNVVETMNMALRQSWIKIAKPKVFVDWSSAERLEDNDDVFSG